MVYLPAISDPSYDSEDLAGVGVVKLTNFGLALDLEEMTTSYHVARTYTNHRNSS